MSNFNAPTNFGGLNQAGTSSLLGSGHQQQQTSNLLGGHQQQANASWLGGNQPGAQGLNQAGTSALFSSGQSYGAPQVGHQQQSTTGLLSGQTHGVGHQQQSTTLLLGGNQPAQNQVDTSALLGGPHQQANTSRLLGNSLGDITAGQLTPLNEPPGTASAARLGQQEAMSKLLGTAGQTQAATQQNLTSGLLGTATQQGQASNLLGPTQAATQQNLTSGLLGTAQGSKEIVTQPDRIEGLRQRSLSQHAKRAVDQATAEITRFGLVFNGEIQSAHLGNSGRGPLMCVFSMKHGADWTVVSGAQTGITQLSTSSLPAVTSLSSAIFRGGRPREVVWNFPIGVAYKSTSPFGWPRLVVTVYGTDLCNRRVIKGYGSVHVPCQPGKHTRTIRLYCPLSSSPITRLLGALFGNPAQLVDPRIVAETEGREVVRVQSGGKVTVTFDVLLKDTEPFNYSF